MCFAQAGMAANTLIFIDHLEHDVTFMHQPSPSACRAYSRTQAPQKTYLKIVLACLSTLAVRKLLKISEAGGCKSGSEVTRVYDMGLHPGVGPVN
jgi:hypothetical protein